MATVYLHIGLHKTGTTALQYFFEDNREVLAGHGICFPDFGFRYRLIDFRRNAHFLIAPCSTDENGRSDYSQLPPEYESTLDKIRQLGNSYDKILLSDEGIWRSSHHWPDFWPRLKAELDKREIDIRIIVYLRRQDLWIQSFWKQKVRGGSTNTLAVHVENMSKSRMYPIDYCACLDMLSGIFGREALIIRIYEKGQYQGPEHTIYSDFLDIFGLTLSDGFRIRQEQYNPSLEGNYLELRRQLNQIPDFYPKDHILKAAINQAQETPGSPESARRTWFAPGEQAAFLARYEESNRRLAREYLGREDGKLFYQELEETPQFVVDDSELLRDTIQVYGRAICMLEQQNRDLKKKYERDIEELRKELLWYRIKRKVRTLMKKIKGNKS